MMMAFRVPLLLSLAVATAVTTCDLVPVDPSAQTSPGPKPLAEAWPYAASTFHYDPAMVQTIEQKGLVLLTIKNATMCAEPGLCFGTAWTTSKILVVAPSDPTKLASTAVVAQLSQFGTNHNERRGAGIDPAWDGAPPSFWYGSDPGNSPAGAALNDLEYSYAKAFAGLRVPIVMGNPVPAAIALNASTVAAIAAYLES